MRIGGHARLWLALVAVLTVLAVPANAAPKKGEIVLRGTEGGITVALPKGVRFVVPEGYQPAPSGKVRGFVIREAAGALVLAAVSVDVPGFDRAAIFQRGQGYDDGRLDGGRYRISLLGDAKGAKDIVIPVEGLAGRRVVEMRGGGFQGGISYPAPDTPPGVVTGEYRAGPLRLYYGMGLIWAWGVQRGVGLHRTKFCLVPTGTDCEPDTDFAINTAESETSGMHLSVPANRTPGEYDMVIDTTSVGEGGRVGMIGYVFL